MSTADVLYPAEREKQPLLCHYYTSAVWLPSVVRFTLCFELSAPSLAQVASAANSMSVLASFMGTALSFTAQLHRALDIGFCLVQVHFDV